MQVLLNINTEADWLALQPLLSRLQITYTTAQTDYKGHNNSEQEQSYQNSLAQHSLSAAYSSTKPDYNLTDIQQINPNY